MTNNAGLGLDKFIDANLKSNKLQKFLKIFAIMADPKIFFNSMKKISLSLFFAKINLNWLNVYFDTIYKLLMRSEKNRSDFWSLLIKDPLQECNNLLLKEYLSRRENIAGIIHEDKLIEKLDNLIENK
jgi:hypothetical protein